MTEEIKKFSFLNKKVPSEDATKVNVTRKRRKEHGSRISLSIKPPDGGWGWVIVLASFFASMFADGVTYSYGVIATEFIKHFDISRSSVGWMASTLVAITLGSGPLVSYLTERFSYRSVSITGSFICSIGFASSYFYGQLWFVFLTSSVIAGLGFGLVYLPSVVIVNEWFEKKRSIALGIAVCGSGLGTFAFSPLIEHLIVTFGWQRSMLAIGCMLLFLVVCSMTYSNVEHKVIGFEERKRKYHYIDEIEIKDTKNENADLKLNKTVDWDEKKEVMLHSNFDLLRNPLFILFSVSMFLTGIGFDSPYLFAKDRAIQEGLTANRGSFLISFMGLGNCVGRVFFGFLASTKYINRYHLYNISLMVGGLVLIVSWGLKSYILMVLNALIFGILTGTFVTLSSIILVDLFGLENLNIAFGLSSIFQAVAVLIGPPLIGLIFDKTLSYNIAYSICGFSIFLSGAIMYLAYFSSKFKEIKFKY